MSALGIATALIVTACSDSDDDAASTATTGADGAATTEVDGVTTTEASGTEDTQAPGTEEPQPADPSLPPVVVGFHNIEGGAVSLPEVREAFESGINYVNEELGGINGRPLEAITCNVDVTPESSVNCANEFVEENVVVAVQGIDVSADAALPIWEEAGLVDIAFFGFSPGINQARGDAFVTLFDTRDILAQNLTVQRELGAESVAIVHEDLPSTQALFDTLEQPTAEQLGIELTPFYYSPTTDWATFAATILSTDPDGIDFPAAQEPVCLAAIPALRAGGFDGPIHAGSCSQYLDELPIEQVEGIINHNEFYYPSMTEIPPKAQQDIDIFLRYMERDVPDLSSVVYGQFGFHIAVQAADMLRQVEGDITPESVRDTMPNTSGPMFFRETGYDCSQNLWPPDSAACSSEVIYTTATADRQKEVLDIEIDTSALRPEE